MSAMTTSGGSASTAASSESPSANDATDRRASIGARTSCSASRMRYESSANDDADRSVARLGWMARARSAGRARTRDQRPDGRVGLAGTGWDHRAVSLETRARLQIRGWGWSPRVDPTAQPRGRATTRSMGGTAHPLDAGPDVMPARTPVLPRAVPPHPRRRPRPRASGAARISRRLRRWCTVRA